MRLSPILLLTAVLIGTFSSINAQYENRNSNNTYIRYQYYPTLVGSFFKLRGRINERLGEITDNVIGGSKKLVRNGVNNIYNAINGFGNTFSRPIYTDSATYSPPHNPPVDHSTDNNNTPTESYTIVDRPGGSNGNLSHGLPSSPNTEYYIQYLDHDGAQKKIYLRDLIVKKNNSQISEERLKVFLKTVDQIQNMAELEKVIFDVKDLYVKITDLEREIDDVEEVKILSRFQSRLASRAQEKELEDAVSSIKNIASKLENLRMLDNIKFAEMNDSVTSLNSVVAEIKNLKNVESMDDVDILVNGLVDMELKKANSVIKKIQDYLEFIDLDKIINTNIDDKDKFAELKKEINETDLKTLWNKLYQPPAAGATADKLKFDDWKLPYTNAIALKGAESLDYYKFSNAIKNLNGAEFNNTLSGLEEMINSGKIEDYIKSLEKISESVKNIPTIEANWAQVKKFGDAPKSAEDLIVALDQLKALQKNLKSEDNYKETLQMYGKIKENPRVLEHLKEVVKQLEKMNSAIVDNSAELTEFINKLDETLLVMDSDKSIDEFRKNVADLRKETNMINDVPNLSRQLKHVEETLNFRALQKFNETLQRVKIAVKKPMEFMRFMALLSHVKEVANTTKDIADFESQLKSIKAQAEIDAGVENLDETLYYVKSPSLTETRIEDQKKIIAEMGKMRKIFDEDKKLIEKLDKIRTLDDAKVKKHKNAFETIKKIKDKSDDKKDILDLTTALKKKSWDNWTKSFNTFETKDVTKADILDEMKYTERFAANNVATLKTELKL